MEFDSHIRDDFTFLSKIFQKGNETDYDIIGKFTEAGPGAHGETLYSMTANTDAS